MNFIFLALVALGVIGVCVAGMAIGVMNGRTPIKHCGSASIGPDGKRTECALCGNKTCKNNSKNTPAT
jgi:hypothetical protein